MNEQKLLSEEFPIGCRVMFEGFGQYDPYSRLRPGAIGTVTYVDDIGTVHVKWDDGSSLGMLVNHGDRIARQ